MVKFGSELLAPAGSFMSAYYAFEAGADAVYVGLQKYSARKSAQNFNFDELSKIKNIAFVNGRKLYIAINTVVRDDEIDDLLESIAECSRIEVDAFIVQDFGVLGLLRKYFPAATIHASTQMAISNSMGIEIAQKMGIERIVLPRELSFDRVAQLRHAFPDMELEVFIHGALCYSYSGLCLASGLLAGRSGNRGECAQVCRLEFDCAGTRGHFLSCRDLFVGKNLLRLAEAGIDSFKIEGRLKPPEYVYNTVKLYRYILDHPSDADDEEYETLLANSEFVFSREKTNGYLFGKDDERIITTTYQRSTGNSIGRVEETSASSFSFTSKTALSINDVLQVFLDDSERLPYKLPVRSMSVSGAQVMRTDKGAFVTIGSEKVPVVGQEVCKVYAKGLELPGVRHKTFAIFKKKLAIRITFESKEHGSIRIETDKNSGPFVYRHPCVYSGPKDHIDLTRLAGIIFTAENLTMYEIEVLEIRNETGRELRDIGVQNRLLGIIRDAFLESVLTSDKETDVALRATIHAQRKKPSAENRSASLKPIREFIANRENLNPISSRLPFFTHCKIDACTVATCGASCFIPMNPVVFDDDPSYYNSIYAFVRDNPGYTIYLGINNIHHFGILDALSGFPNVFAFLDFFFFVANVYTIDFALEANSRIVFGYYWIEGGDSDFKALSNSARFPLIKLDAGFSPPYFFHTGSFSRESLGIENGEHAERLLQYKEYIFNVIEGRQLASIFLTNSHACDIGP
jgi:putative protease